MRASDPGNVYKLRTTNLTGHFDSSARLPYSPLQSPGAKSLERKKSFWQSLRRKSDSAIEDRTRQQDIKSPIPGSQRGKRGLENKFHTSVDLSAPSAKNCPPIVRAAQRGSIDDIESLLEAHADVDECHWPIGRNAMAVAAHCGNEEVVELLFRHGAKISQKDSLHYTPLHLAASRGHIGVLQFLLSEGAPLEEMGPDDKTALRLSCDSGHLEAAEFLLARGAKVNARDKGNLTSLHAAAKRGDFHTVALLIKYGAHVQAKDAKFMDALHYACDGGYNNVVELLLNKKVDIETLGTEGRTPLMTAASAGHVHTVDFLLKRKASLKAKGSGDMTALHWAAFNGQVEVVDLLAQKKAPINAVNVDGRTPLHLAVMAEHFAVVELLLRKNAALEAQCRNLFRPLHYACGFDNTDIALLLLRSGADVEASASLQNRPLHLAITSGNISNVTMLLEHGANIDARNANGDRALLLASSHGHTAIVKALLDRGAPLRSKFAVGPSHEDSPLCIAAKNGHSDVVDLLIGRGASVREKDEHDWQPLRYGAYYAHPEVVERLLAAGASISGIQTWGFNLTADTIGFAPYVNIPEDRKEHVMILLRNAEERERLIQESEFVGYRSSQDTDGVPELDQATQTKHVELRSSTTRAGPGKLSRRFSYEPLSQSRSESQYSDSDQPQPQPQPQPQSQPYTVSPLPPGEPGLIGGRNKLERDTVSPLPYHMERLSSANMDTRTTTPARTNSEHVSSRYKDVTKRWQEAVTDKPNRSATVASNVYNLRRSDVSQPSAFSPRPSAMSYQTLSDIDGPPMNRAAEASYTSMSWSPDSITRPLAEGVARPPPPTRPPPPPPPAMQSVPSWNLRESPPVADSVVRPWQVMPEGRFEMG
jgi:ankyrin repeat protein